MNQTFEQKRIVELSKKLDQQRLRCQNLVKETHDQAKQIQYLQQGFEQQQQQKQRLQIAQRQLKSQISNLIQQNCLLRQEKTVLQKKLIESEYTTMRLKQQIQQLKQEHKLEIQKIKQQIFGLQQIIAQKDKDNMKLRQQNLQLQKMYLNKRQQMQRNQEKHFKQLNKLTLDFKTLKSEMVQIGKVWQTSLEKEKTKIQELCQQFFDKVKEVESRIEDAAKLRKHINQLQQNLEEVVVQNSQRIIELYNVKYSQR